MREGSELGDSAQFDRLASLLRRRYGLSLGPDKASLAASRLQRLASEQGLGLSAYLERRLAAPGDDYSDLVDRLTTTFTSFFRGAEQFRILREVVLPAWGESRPLTVCSAGCASGEEPYSVLITIAEKWGLEALEKVRVLALDVSRPALERARRGVYSETEVGSMVDGGRRRFFLRGRGAAAGLYRVRPELRRPVEFRRVNLAASLPGLPRFDLVLCANVMIYFETSTREAVCRRLTACLRPGGFFVLGSAESLPPGRWNLVPVGPSAYRREDPQ